MLAGETQEDAMNYLEFDKVVREQFEDSLKTLSSKASEYASAGDRFHNFHIAGRIRNCTREQAMDGMAVKHEVVIRDWIESSDRDPERFTPDALTEKIGDMINYLLLLKGMLADRHSTSLRLERLLRESDRHAENLQREQEHLEELRQRPSWTETENPKDIRKEEDVAEGTEDPEMNLYVFVSKSMAAFCAGFVAEDVNEAIKLMDKENSYDAQKAAKGEYDVKVFELNGSHEKGEAFWEEE